MGQLAKQMVERSTRTFGANTEMNHKEQCEVIFTRMESDKKEKRIEEDCDPEGVEAWLKEIEKIFWVTECPDQQKVLFATHMLANEAEYWWEDTRPHLEGVGGVVVPWGTFRQTFLEKYFPEDVKNRKEMEFLELKQGSMMVAEYAVKFENLVRYFPHYQGEAGERSKCVKFVNGL